MRITTDLAGYLGNQITAVSRGGLPIIAWKISLFVQLILAVPIVLLVRLLRPLWLVRFRPLSNRMGQFVGSTELYLCQRDLGMHDGRILDLFYFLRTIPNRFVKKKWQQQLHVYFFVYALDRMNKMIPGGRKHIIPMPEVRDLDGLMEKTEIHFTFTQEEEEKGQALLRKYGVPEGAPLICFQARDPSYLLERSGLPGFYDYHDYRDSDITTYLMAADRLTELGYYALRMGAIVDRDARSANPNVIDYSTFHRNEFMDIYLSARCSFYLVDTAGMSAVAATFRRPLAFVNYAPLENVQTWREETLTILKKHWLRHEERYMTFREILESGAGLFFAVAKFQEMGIDLHDNTPEEIAAVALEMEARTSGTWETTQEDEDLQRRFWSLFKPSDWNREFRSRIGSQFLRENPYLLD